MESKASEYGASDGEDASGIGDSSGEFNSVQAFEGEPAAVWTEAGIGGMVALA